MTNDGIIRMAREAGGSRWEVDWCFEMENLERFFHLAYAAGAAAEREACAVLCDDIEVERWALFKGRTPHTGQEEGRASNYVQGESDGAGKCAAAIRARGQQ